MTDTNVLNEHAAHVMQEAILHRHEIMARDPALAHRRPEAANVIITVRAVLNDADIQAAPGFGEAWAEHRCHELLAFHKMLPQVVKAAVWEAWREILGDPRLKAAAVGTGFDPHR